LQAFLDAEKVKAKIVRFETPVKTVKEAAQKVNQSTKGIVKTIVYLADEEPILVILLGSQQIDEEKLKQATGSISVRLASSEEVEEATGYSPGGVPPISIYGVRTLIQKEVEQQGVVYTGGGDEYSLLQIDASLILEFAFEPKIVDVAV
jgi:prolyl-tRNA editing enzyme YbaK/EbsC (Cys-tRNA(Pro) deacylase)